MVSTRADSCFSLVSFLVRPDRMRSHSVDAIAMNIIFSHRRALGRRVSGIRVLSVIPSGQHSCTK